MSFIADKIVMDGLTYDDVLLIPAYSEVLPKTVELTTKFSRNIELKVPFVTAAMDTVTEAKMAIAIAREGGIGVIHKNMSIEEQARQVAIVKRAENGMIYDPVTIKRGSTVRDALALMSEYRIGGIPVVDDERYLVGIVTNRDLRFEKDMDKRIDEVMTKENIVTTNQSTDMEAASQILQEHKIEKLPVVDKDGKLVGLITYKDITKAKDKPMACKDAAYIISRINGFTYVQTEYDIPTQTLKVVKEIPFSEGERAAVKCYGANDVMEGVAIMKKEDVQCSITGNSTNPVRFQHLVAGTYKKWAIENGKKYFSVASGGGTGRTLHPDNVAAGPASYGLTDSLGRVHGDAQFAGSSSVPAHVEMMGLIGMGNNPMVGATVACAVAAAQANA